MTNQLLRKEDEQIRILFRNLDSLQRSLEFMEESKTPSLLSDNYITDYELSKLLKVSRRCLQEYRYKGILPYYQICGKVLYKESHILELLKKSFVDKYNNK